MDWREEKVRGRMWRQSLMLMQQSRKAMKVAGTKLVAVGIREYDLKLRKNCTTQ